MTNLSISIVIPVLREQEGIIKCIDAVRAISSGGEAQIIVVDGSPDGETAKALEGSSDVLVLRSDMGRGRQMNYGARHAHGDVIVFLHADTRLPYNAIAAIRDSGYPCGAFDLGIYSPRPIYRLIEAIVAFRCRLTAIPYGDQAIFVRRELFESLGGYKEIPLMEDVELMRCLKRKGYKVQLIPHKVSTSARRWAKHGVIFCTLRNTAMLVLYMLGVSPERLASHYYKY